MSDTGPVIEATDFLVETANPDYLDSTLQQLPGAQVLVGGGMPGGYVKREGYYVMRVFGDPGFIKFACEAQGYCKIVRQLEQTV
jgi:hypothetical protein